VVTRRTPSHGVERKREEEDDRMKKVVSGSGGVCVFKWVDGQTASPWTIETIRSIIITSIVQFGSSLDFRIIVI
jgi:hypothetical protein